MSWETKILKLLEFWGVDPNGLEVYKEALTHPSFANDNHLKYNYERLEFLGDSIIAYAVTQYLWNNFPKASPKLLTEKRIKLVKGSSLAISCKLANIAPLIRVGRSDHTNAISDRIYEDVYESFCGAIMLNEGIEKAIQFITATLITYGEHDKLLDNINYKSWVNEYMQERYRKAPVYETEQLGRNKFRTFLSVGKETFSGEAGSIKNAQNEAASKAYASLKKQ